MTLYNASRRIQKVADLAIQRIHERDAVRMSGAFYGIIDDLAEYYSVSADKLAEVVLDMTEGQR